jgi:hypothetical protein
MKNATQAVVVALTFIATSPAQSVPNIANITNAAFPSLDYPPASLTIPPRSMATIWGTNLADRTASTAPPWVTALGGTEVHLASDVCFDSSCELIANLVFVSPTQINFVIPSPPSGSLKRYRIVLMRDGQRIDNRAYMLGGPGRIIIDPNVGDGWDYDVVFAIGYECLYSYSLSNPAACGLSWSQGQHRALLGAVTDSATGKLFDSQNPVHQGQIISIWMTGLRGQLSMQNGLLTASSQPVNFGVAQLGKDLVSPMDFGLNGPYYQGNPLGGWDLQTGTPLWTGESSQYVGLDQMNVAFPTCINASPATAEKRYDAFMMYGMQGSLVRLYLPFVVRPGDPDCKF